MFQRSIFSLRCMLAACVSLLYFTSGNVLGQLLSERQQKMRLAVQNDKNVSTFTINEELRTPSFITFKKDALYTRETAPVLIRKFYQLTDNDVLKVQGSTAIQGGLLVERYKQYRNGIRIEHGVYVVTTQDAKIFSINAESFELPAGFSVVPALKEEQAKEKVLSFVNAKQYAWQYLEKQKVNSNPEAQKSLESLIEEYSPKGELVISKAKYQGGQARLAYKFDIYATEPLSRSLIYVDARSGEILLVDPLIKHTTKALPKQTPKANSGKKNFSFFEKASYSAEPAFNQAAPLRVTSELGTAKTRYAGSRSIFTTRLSVIPGVTTDPNNTTALITWSGATPRTPILTAQDVFILKDDTRGKGVETFDLNGVGGLPISVPGLEGTALAFVDKDNNWKDENALSLTNEDLMRGATQPPAGGGAEEALNDDIAIDAHWGAEMVYDYWKQRHGRLSYDNANTSIRSFVHYGPAYDNAFWNGSVMTYGDGSGGAAGGFKPLVSLDVCGHEIGHGVCSFTSDLVYQGESGAMNEGLSDIWAAALENYVSLLPGAVPAYQPFQIGEQIDPAGVGLRRMDNPSAFGNPDTYGGTNWDDPNCAVPSLANDQCGVHNNSGVLNKWFYLLVKGPLATTGSPAFVDLGLNDLNENYGALPNFVGLGFVKAEKITYMMELMLTPNATFADARTASINAAIALYGACSQEEITVTDAWYAVNVGDAFTTCTAPLLSVVMPVTEVSEFAAGACDRYTDYPINASLTAAQASDVLISFTVSNATIGATEYQIIPSSVTYTAGQTGTKTAVLRIFDDAMVEGSESLTIKATSSLAALNVDLPITIIDDDVTPVIGGTVTLLSENFESTAANAIPTGWMTIDKISPTPVKWKVLSPPVSLPIGTALVWTSKRAVIEATGVAGLATYNTLAAAQTILRAPIINALGLSGVKVSFTFNAGGEPACDPACDYGQLVYSYDGTNFLPFTAESTPLYLTPGDQSVTTELPASFNNSQFYIGFLWNNDANAGAVLSVTIDNVVVTASGKTIESQLNATTTQKVFPETGHPVYFYSGNDDQLMASIESASADLGCVSVTVSEEGNGGVTFLTGKRSKKVFTITPAQNSSANYTLSLYYKTTELTGGFTGVPLDLKLLKTNATTVANATTANSLVVTPVIENQSAKGYYKYTYTFSGFSKFFLVEGVEGALPVVLVNFRAQKNESTAKLNWETTSELASSYFEVERSTNAADFQALGTVRSAGNSNKQNTYAFEDSAPASGANYYRLKMVDLDGSFGYSKIIALEFESEKGFTVYPNPVSNKLAIKLNKHLKGTMRLINVGGQLVKRKTISGAGTDFDVSDLPEGVYVIEITRDNGMKEVQKVVIRH